MNARTLPVIALTLLIAACAPDSRAPTAAATADGGWRAPRNRNASKNLKIIERFTPIDENTLRWEVRFEDPDTWTAPWSIEMPLKRNADAVPYEYACHEGNYGLRNILSAARAAERDAAAE